MAELSVRQYDALERAIVDARRISVFRRGTEYIVIPTRLVLQNGKEALETRHPTTGDRLVILLDDADSVEVV